MKFPTFVLKRLHRLQWKLRISYLITCVIVLCLFELLVALIGVGVTLSQDRETLEHHAQRLARIAGPTFPATRVAYQQQLQAAWELLQESNPAFQGYIAAVDAKLIVFSLAVSVLSIPIAFIRPRNQNIPSWLVTFATWTFGIGMTLYRLSYFIVAFLNIHAGHFWTYIAAGGLNWTIEGILFIMVTWLANCSGRDAQTRDGEPASIVAQRREERDNLKDCCSSAPASKRGR